MLISATKGNRWLVPGLVCCVLTLLVLGSFETTKAGEPQSGEFPVEWLAPGPESLHMAPTSTATHPNPHTPPLEMQYLPSGGSALPESQGPDRLSASPDLVVRFIERTPAYPYNERQKWPEPGETVTFTAHIANFGDVSSGSFAYSWSIDGVRLDQSTHPGLAVDQKDRLAFSWVWEHGAHTVQVSLDTESAITEVSETNNTVTDRTDALSLGIWVEQSFYDFFNDNVFSAGWGGNSFDDWIQRHVDIWNDMFADAGMLDRVRLAKVVVAPDGDLNCQTNVPANDLTVDLMWGFLSDQVGVPSPAQCTGWTPRYRDDPSTWDRDMALIHELNHARYHIDLYGFNMYVHARPLAAAMDTTVQTLHLTDPPDFVEFQPPVYFAIDGELVYCTVRSEATFSNCSRGVEGTTPGAHDPGTPVYVATVRILDDQGNAVLGTAALPVTGTNGDFIYKEPYSGVDIMDGGTGYGEYSAYVLNRIAGQRARCGNYNAPCNIGEFLDEIPPHNGLELRWPNGQPVSNASVDVYRARAFPGVWYARQYVSTPDLQFVTDENGQADLGAFPFSASGDITHTWGHSNALLLLKITTQAGIEIRFLDVMTFNLAYWKGIKDPTYPITLTNAIESPSLGLPLRRSLSPVADPAPGIRSFSPLSTSAFINGNLLVAQATSNAVSIINTETGDAVREPVAVGQFPNWLSATSDGIFVVNGQSDSISVLDRATCDVLNTISVGSSPRCMTVASDGQYGYVANNASKSVSVVDLQSGATLDSLSLNAHPEAAIASPNGAQVYVAANTPGKIVSVNASSNQIGDWFHVGKQPQAIDLSPDGQYLYIVDFAGRLLFTVEATGAQIVDVLALPGDPHRIIIAPDGSKAYVANHSLNHLYVVSLSTHRVVETISLQSPQWAMDMSPGGQYLFVSLYDGKEVVGIDTASHTVIRRFATSGNPTAVYFDQPTHQIYLPLIIRLANGLVRPDIHRRPLFGF